MMKYLNALLPLLCLSGFGLPANAQEGKGTPLTVVELFTSQGCYSCPPADDLLAELDQDHTITLSCHVSYWNYLGWKDTFSKPYCDNRQRIYQSALKGNPGVYTPQMVINGRYGAVGSREPTVNQAIKIMARENRIERLDLHVESAGTLVLKLPALDVKQQYQLILMGTSGTQTVPINRGENGGKMLDYHNPVAIVENLGRWDGEPKVLMQKLARQTEVKEWVVLAQTWPIGEIVAAGKITLAE